MCPDGEDNERSKNENVTPKVLKFPPLNDCLMIQDDEGDAEVVGSGVGEDEAEDVIQVFQKRILRKKERSHYRPRLSRKLVDHSECQKEQIISWIKPLWCDDESVSRYEIS